MSPQKKTIIYLPSLACRYCCSLGNWALTLQIQYRLSPWPRYPAIGKLPSSKCKELRTLLIAVSRDKRHPLGALLMEWSSWLLIHNDIADKRIKRMRRVNIYELKGTKDEVRHSGNSTEDVDIRVKTKLAHCVTPRLMWDTAAIKGWPSSLQMSIGREVYTNNITYNICSHSEVTWDTISRFDWKQLCSVRQLTSAYKWQGQVYKELRSSFDWNLCCFLTK